MTQKFEMCPQLFSARQFDEKNQVKIALKSAKMGWKSMSLK